MGAAATRLSNSAQNVASAQNEGYRPRRTQQVAERDGGVRASTRVAKSPERVSYAQEFVEQTLAKTQFKASTRTLETELELRGNLLDILA